MPTEAPSNGRIPAPLAAESVTSGTEDELRLLFATESSAQASASATLTADYELITDQARLAEVIASLGEARVLAVDTETTGLDPFVENTLLLVQVATPERAYVIDARRVDARPLRRLLEDEKTLKLLQNAKFDYKMLRQQLGIAVRNIYDTMLAERLLTAGVSREIGLAAIAKKYLHVELDKAVRGSFVGSNGTFTEEQLRYAARDVLALFGIYEEQRKALQQERLLTTALLEFRTVVAVGEMELAGCLIDQEKWRGIIANATAERDRAAQELGDMLVKAGAVPQLTLFGGPAINLNSNAQLIECFRMMGLDLPDTMEATLLKYDHPAIKKLLEYRSFEKTISAFGEKFLELIHSHTGRIHPDFNQLGADTGRFSCTNPNIQQIPATSDFRSCFIAAPGYKLITCDYSQAELRILAQLSEDPAFVEAFCSGGDLHQLTASQMYQVPPDQVTKQMRGAAKVINFGLAYGRGPAALGTQLGVSTEEARKLIDQYFKAYAGIGKWLDRAARDAVRKGYSSTILGRKRYYPSLEPGDPEYTRKRASIERQGKNSPIQGANADMTKLALVALTEVLPDYHARIVNTVHDEIVVEAPEDQADAVCSIVQREMVKAGEQIISLVPIVAEAKIADYWSK
jgi:DNA polymerase-1